MPALRRADADSLARPDLDGEVDEAAERLRAGDDEREATLEAIDHVEAQAAMASVSTTGL